MIENAVNGKVSVEEASRLLNLSSRQVKRLKRRYQADTVDWVRHGNRGRPSEKALHKSEREKIVELARGKYAGFNDTHLTEKLNQQEGIEASRETVRRILRQAGVKSPQKRRAVKYRSRRERKPRMGMMVLTDASREDWLEGRGPALTLIAYQDDATGRVLSGGFQLQPEDTVGYLRQLRAMVEAHGIPVSLYRDQHATFQRNDKHWTLEEQLAGRQTPTQLGRVLEELGIESIRALSAQAKGRIERMWKTFQDRLRSELRLARSRTLEQANAVLEKFMGAYNQQFAVTPREAASDFRRLNRRLNGDRLFSLKYYRVVGKDHVIEFGARSIQLPPGRGKSSYAGARVELSHQLNGELHVWLGDERLHSMACGLDYAPGLAPQRPARRPRKQPRIYVHGGRPAIAVRP
ncbi:MAG: ISNCY family transposase [Candidatus Acidiferrales bacterium]